MQTNASHKNPRQESVQLVADGGTRWKQLSAKERDILISVGILGRQDGPTRGVDVYRHVNNVPDDAAPRPNPPIYDKLRRLVSRGLIYSQSADGAKGKDYSLTESGQTLLDTRLCELADATGATVAFPESDKDSTTALPDGGTAISCPHKTDGPGNYAEIELDGAADLVSGYVCDRCAKQVIKLLSAEAPAQIDIETTAGDTPEVGIDLERGP